MDIQPTMTRTVSWLQNLGYRTTDSGDGILNVEAGTYRRKTIPVKTEQRKGIRYVACNAPRGGR